MEYGQYLTFVIAAGVLVKSSHSDDCSGIVSTLEPSSEGCSHLGLVGNQFTQLLTMDFWESFCRSSSVIDSCLVERYEKCTTNTPSVTGPVAIRLYPSAEAVSIMVTEGCNGDAVSDTITQLFDRPCINDKIKDTITQCVETWLDESSDVRSVEWNHLTNYRRQSLRRYARSTFGCVLSSVLRSCLPEVYPGLTYAINLTLPLPLRSQFPIEEVSKIPLSKSITHSTVRNTVGIFGDSHLLVYDVTTPVTCSLMGKNVLLSNPIMEIVGNYEQASDHTGTIMNSIEIEFRHTGNRLGAYKAEGNELPSHFQNLADEQNLGRQEDRRISISTINTTPHKKIRINSTVKAFEILIQRTNTGYVLMLRISGGVLQISGGLLVTGCSYSKQQNVNITAALDRALPADVTMCKEACSDLNVTSDGVDLVPVCLYDCITSPRKDSQVTDLSAMVLADLVDIEGRDDELTLIAPAPTDPPKLVKVSGAPSVVMTSFVYILAFMATRL